MSYGPRRVPRVSATVFSVDYTGRTAAQTGIVSTGVDLMLDPRASSVATWRQGRSYRHARYFFASGCQFISSVIGAAALWQSQFRPCDRRDVRHDGILVINNDGGAK